MVVEELVGVGLPQKFGSGPEGFDRIEFILDRPVEGLDIGVPRRSGRRDPFVADLRQGQDLLEFAGFGSLLLHIADKLAAVIGLDANVLELHSIVGQMSGQVVIM